MMVANICEEPTKYSTTNLDWPHSSPRVDTNYQLTDTMGYFLCSFFRRIFVQLISLLTV